MQESFQYGYESIYGSDKEQVSDAERVFEGSIEK